MSQMLRWLVSPAPLKRRKYLGGAQAKQPHLGLVSMAYPPLKRVLVIMKGQNKSLKPNLG
jgi:hypothetical protein